MDRLLTFASNPSNPHTSAQAVYRGPAAPLTSLALSTDEQTIFAGCWDKSVWSWDVRSRKQKRRYIGHSDFVKSVLIVSTPSRSATTPTDILISGSADSSVIIWAVDSGEKLHIIRGADHARAILDLKINPSTYRATQDTTRFTLYAGCSDPAIRRWQITVPVPPASVTVDPLPDINVHETSVNNLCFAAMPADEDDHAPARDTYALLTASSDKTAKRLIDISKPSGSDGTSAAMAEDQNSTVDSDNIYEPKTSFPHPDFVRAVVVSAANNSVVTACRDGEIRVFDLDADGSDVEPVYVFTGHFEEVTALALVRMPGGNGDLLDNLISVSIDGTVRRWGGLSQDDLERAAASAGLDWEENDPSGAGGTGNGIELTAEEEAELAELMDSDDE